MAVQSMIHWSIYWQQAVSAHVALPPGITVSLPPKQGVLAPFGIHFHLCPNGALGKGELACMSCATDHL